MSRHLCSKIKDILPCLPGQALDFSIFSKHKYKIFLLITFSKIFIKSVVWAITFELKKIKLGFLLKSASNEYKQTLAVNYIFPGMRAGGALLSIWAKACDFWSIFAVL